MRKAELVQLVGYTDYVWRQFREVIPDEALSREAPGSGWPALRDCLGHMVNAHERWVPAILDLQTGELPAIGEYEFRRWDQLDEARDRIRGRLMAALEEWGDGELGVMQEVDVDGEVVQYSRGELIAHLMLHERGHHGDVTTLLWQLGIEADLALEYRFFLGR